MFLLFFVYYEFKEDDLVKKWLSISKNTNKEQSLVWAENFFSRNYETNKRIPVFKMSLYLSSVESNSFRTESWKRLRVHNTWLLIITVLPILGEGIRSIMQYRALKCCIYIESPI